LFDTLGQTSTHGGVFVNEKEILPPGYLRNRVGFIYEDHHYQIIHNKHTFAHKHRHAKGGKFILLCDGWEVRNEISYFLPWYAGTISVRTGNTKRAMRLLKWCVQLSCIVRLDVSDLLNLFF
jgi:hypothetical protein